MGNLTKTFLLRLPLCWALTLNAASSLPGGGSYTAGVGRITASGNTLTINQSSLRGIIDWNTFSISGGASVRFNNGGGATLNRVYWRTDFNRLNKLPKEAVYALRLVGQASSTNLLYTEKLNGGGPDILRGYDPYSILGDRGVIISNELRTPALSPWPEHGAGKAQFYIFWDYGHLRAAKTFAGEVNAVSASSVGTGVRYDVRTNVAAHVNYGRALIQLPDTNSAARNNFVDLPLTLVY